MVLYVCMYVYDTLFVWLSEYRLLFIEVASEEYQITSFFGLRNQDLPQVFTMCMYVCMYVCAVHVFEPVIIFPLTSNMMMEYLLEVDDLGLGRPGRLEEVLLLRLPLFGIRHGPAGGTARGSPARPQQGGLRLGRVQKRYEVSGALILIGAVSSVQYYHLLTWFHYYVSLIFPLLLYVLYVQHCKCNDKV